MTNFRSAGLSFFPWEFVTYLIHAFGLNDCEASDLSNQTQHLIDAGCWQDHIVEELWIWADMLYNNGSEMQPMWDRVKQLQGSFEPAPQI